jgi:hypothetical protein
MNDEKFIGKKFGTLTVLSKANNSKSGQNRWLCECICGDKTTVLEKTLFKTVRSYHCSCNMRVSNDPLFSEHTLFKIYKKKCAADRGYHFNLDFDYFCTLIKKDCFYCGNPPCKRNYKEAPKGFLL